MDVLLDVQNAMNVLLIKNGVKELHYGVVAQVSSHFLQIVHLDALKASVMNALLEIRVV